MLGGRSKSLYFPKAEIQASEKLETVRCVTQLGRGEFVSI